MKTVVIVEPVSSGWKLIPKAKRFGHRVIVLTANEGERIVPDEFLSEADQVVTVDTNDDDATLQKVVELHAAQPIDGVVPGFEYYVPIANIINAKLGLRGLNPETVFNLRFKNLMRAALQEKGVRVPRFSLLTGQEQLSEAVDHVGFPCVIKPVDGSGSANVRKVVNESELAEGFAVIQATEFTDLARVAKRDVLMEEYIEGPEYSIEGYVDGEEIRFLSITEKLLGPEPYFVEVGHIVTANLPHEVQESILAYVQDVVRALDVTMGPFHAEIRLSADGPVLMEIGARLAGDRIGDLIRLAKGIDLYEVILNSYLGLPLPVVGRYGEEQGHRYAGIKFFIRPGLAMYRELKGEERVRAEDGFQEMAITRNPETEIPEVTSFMGRLGFAVFVKDSYEELKETLDRIDGMLEFAGPAVSEVSH